MSKGWHDVQLGDLIDIKHGFAFKGSFFNNEPQGDILLTPGNFSIGGGFKGDKLKYYDGPVPEAFVLQQGDLLVAMTDLSKQSDTLGYPAFVPDSSDGRRYLHNQRLGKIVTRKNIETDLRYIYYLMCSDAYRNEVLAGATGTTVKHTSPDRIKQFQFSLPPLSEQRAIAHNLGTLDDKIELNRRMNQTLEEMARTLFKSWFIDFDPVRAKMTGRWRPGQSLPGLAAHLYDVFPDHLVHSSLGHMPCGWAVTAIKNEFKLTMGQSPPGSTYNDNHRGLPFYQGSSDFAFRYPRRRVYCTRPTRIGMPGDTLVSVRAPVGAINMAADKCAIGRGVAAVIHNSGSSSYTYYFMQHLRDQLQGFDDEGTVFGSITKRDFNTVACYAPLAAIIAAFDRTVSSVDLRIRSAERESSSLVDVRDTLMTKLLYR